jgi:NADP-dependent 3-hydroxy acid dehydrogenase YdfG
MDVKNKIVWVVGASSGIGEATAYAFARQGSRVVISARRTDELLRVQAQCKTLNAECEVVPLDVTDHAQIVTAVGQIKSKFGAIDILFLNSGITQRSLVYETGIEVDRRLMEINFFGNVAVAKAVLPLMLEQGDGHLIVNTSITGKFGFPLRSGYSATKHALHGFFDSVRAEVYDKNIRVTIVVPGRINTPISLSALDKDGKPYGKMDAGQANGYPVDKCAHKIVRAVQRNRKEIVIGGKETLMVHIRRFFPCMYYRLARKVKPT